MAAESEAADVALAASGDARAFERLYRTHLARPWVAGAHGALDEQRLETVLPLVEDQGDGRRLGARLRRRFHRPPRREPAPHVLDGTHEGATAR